MKKHAGSLVMDILDKAVCVIHDGEAWLPSKLVAEMLNRFASSFFRAGEMES